jgi:hypothetical protein
MRRHALLILAALVMMFLAGCVVRTRTGPAYRSGHPNSHRHDHCHDRGGKHHKRVCHDHPHGPGHH